MLLGFGRPFDSLQCGPIQEIRIVSEVDTEVQDPIYVLRFVCPEGIVAGVLPDSLLQPRRDGSNLNEEVSLTVALDL